MRHLVSRAASETASARKNHCLRLGMVYKQLKSQTKPTKRPHSTRFPFCQLPAVGNGPPLSDIKKGQTLAFGESNLSHCEVARRVDRSAKVVSNFLRDPTAYGTNYKPGRERALDDRGRRRLFDEARKTESSARKLQATLQLSASVCTTQRELLQNGSCEYVKRNHAPALTPAHRNKHAKWAKEILEEGTRWDEIIFSDEKKFNTDGRDGLQSYWYHLRDEKQSFFSRHSGGGSVVMWGCFSSRGLSDLAFISGRQNSKKCCSTLGDYLPPFAHQRHAKTSSSSKIECRATELETRPRSSASMA